MMLLREFFQGIICLCGFGLFVILLSRFLPPTPSDPSFASLAALPQPGALFPSVVQLPTFYSSLLLQPFPLLGAPDSSAASSYHPPGFWGPSL